MLCVRVYCNSSIHDRQILLIIDKCGITTAKKEHK